MANLSALLGLGGGVSASGEEIYPFAVINESLIGGHSSFVDILPLVNRKGIIDKLAVSPYTGYTIVYLWLRVTIDGGTPFEIYKTISYSGSKDCDVLLNFKYDTSIRIEARNNGLLLPFYYSYRLTHRWQ